MGYRCDRTQEISVRDPDEMGSFDQVQAVVYTLVIKHTQEVSLVSVVGSAKDDGLGYK